MHSNTLFNVSISLNGKWIHTSTKILTIFEFCSWHGIEIPRFCYHEKLSIAGNCRMCLVEIYKSFKPIVSCATPIANKMELYTDTALIKNSREHILEFLLINHPLDCPICDQGGECDLQDQAMVYGSDRGRFHEMKRSVHDKQMGPLIKTIMTRCIHCTRCIRFSNEVGNEPILGTTGRGKNTEIGMYSESSFHNIFSGNLIDLCPVGALTSKPFAFTARSWELRSTESIDILDTLGSSIRIDSRGSEIMRILPVYNKYSDEEWITDKIRFCYDGLKYQRLTVPMFKVSKLSGFHYVNVSWQLALNIFIHAFSKNFFISPLKKNIFFFTGDLLDLESSLLVKYISNQLGIPFLNSVTSFSNDLRANFLLSSSIKDFEQFDAYLLLNTNLLYEASLLHLKMIKKSYSFPKKWIGYIGPNIQSYSAVKHISSSNRAFTRFSEGRHFSCIPFKRSKKSALVGNSQFPLSFASSLFLQNRDDISFSFVNKNINQLIRNEFNVYSNLMWNSSFNRKSTFPFQYVVGNYKEALPSAGFRVYQGHHGDLNATNANLLLPTGAFSEKSAYYISNEGRFLRTASAIGLPGIVKNDFDVLLALICLLNLPVGATSFERLMDQFPYTLSSKSILSRSFGRGLKKRSKHFSTILTNHSLQSSVVNFYQTDVISKSSQILNSCRSFVLNNF
jgi:NADH dehydrogenase (ubiquinone) Fe-S protein 1